MRCLISQADNKMFRKIETVGIKCITSHMSEELQFGHILCQDGIWEFAVNAQITLQFLQIYSGLSWYRLEIINSGRTLRCQTIYQHTFCLQRSDHTFSSTSYKSLAKSPLSYMLRTAFMNAAYILLSKCRKQLHPQAISFKTGRLW